MRPLLKTAPAQSALPTRSSPRTLSATHVSASARHVVLERSLKAAATARRPKMTLCVSPALMARTKTVTRRVRRRQQRVAPLNISLRAPIQRRQKMIRSARPAEKAAPADRPSQVCRDEQRLSGVWTNSLSCYWCRHSKIHHPCKAEGSTTTPLLT